MKTSLITLTLLFYLNALSAQTTDSLSKSIDSRFLGSWSGFDKGSQIKGTTIYWIQHRMADGTYIFLYTAINKKGSVESFSEKGKWWVENGIFYELHNASGKTNTYTFTILDANRIKFKLKSTELNFDGDSYEFIDTKIDEE
jgi:hypothetical protein